MTDENIPPRLFYPRELKPAVRRYDRSEPIRGLIAFRGGVPPKHITVGRYLEDGTERVVDHVELDGVRYTADGIDLQEHYEDGRCVAVDLDGVRYERARSCVMAKTYGGYPCNDYTCSACGKTSCSERAPQFCPRCGAKREKIVDKDGNELTANEGATCIGAEHA